MFQPTLVWGRPTPQTTRRWWWATEQYFNHKRRSCCLHNHGWIGRHAFPNHKAKRRLSLATITVQHVCIFISNSGLQLLFPMYVLVQFPWTNPRTIRARTRAPLAHEPAHEPAHLSRTNSRTTRARTRAPSDGSALRENARDVKRAWGI